MRTLPQPGTLPLMTLGMKPAESKTKNRVFTCRKKENNALHFRSYKYKKAIEAPIHIVINFDIANG